MWRRLMFKVGLAKRVSVRACNIQIQSGRNSKQGSKDFTPKLIFKNVAKVVLGTQMIGSHLEEEKNRASKVQHVILLGTDRPAIEFLEKLITGKDKVNTNNSQNNTQKKENQITKLFNREIKVSTVFEDKNMKKESYKQDLESLPIFEHYSVVFCFPLPENRITQDLKWIQTFLKYRQREDFQRITVAFIDSDCPICKHAKSADKRRDISNLADCLKPYGGQWSYFSSCERNKRENNSNLKELVKSMPCTEFKSKIMVTGAFYVMPHFYFFLKF